MSRRQIDRAEAARIAGIKPDTLTDYLKADPPKAPPPDGKIGNSPWWYESTIRRWAKGRKTTPGRAPKALAQ